MFRVILSVALVLVVMLFGSVLIGTAHGIELLRSEPADGAVLDSSPAQVKAWFNEELQTEESALQVFDSANQQVDGGDGGVDLTDPQHATLVANLPAGLADGAYTVHWRANLLDGDASEGAFSFYVGQSGAQRATEVAGEGMTASTDAASDGDPAAIPAGTVFIVSVFSLIVAGIGIGTIAQRRRAKRPIKRM